MSMATGSYHMSPAAGLLEPQNQLKHSRNGELKQSHSSSPVPSTRSSSEPISHFPLSPSSELTVASRVSNDDTYSSLGKQGFNQRTTYPRNEHFMPLKTIDPKELLNPKKFDSSQRARDEKRNITAFQPSHSNVSANNQFTFTSNDHDSKDDTSPEPESSGMRNLIEKVHNVEKREDRPRKKQKKNYLEDQAEISKPKSAFNGGGKGGEIGDYMREKRKEGQEECGPTATIVDLTAGELQLWASLVFFLLIE